MLTATTRYLPTREEMRDHLNGFHAVNYMQTRDVALIPLADHHVLAHRTLDPYYMHSPIDYRKGVEIV